MEMEKRPEEGSGISLFHAFLLLDGSGSMQELEHRSGTPKHKAVAAMVQSLIDELHDDPTIINTQLSIVAYDGGRVDDIRLKDYDTKSGQHCRQANLDLWDPLVGHGGSTPIGRALSFGRGLAEQWVNEAQGMEVRRAVIYLMSDGMRYPDTEPDGMAESQAIRDFNAQQDQLRNQGGFKGRIRLASVGYYQHSEGADAEEDKGRELLRSLPDNPKANFVTSTATEIADYIRRTIARL